MKRFSPVELQGEATAVADAGSGHHTDDLQLDV